MAIPPVAAGTPSIPSSFVLGAEWSRSFRRGYFDIRGFEQDSAQRPLSLWGIYAGKRYDFTPWLRLQLAAEISYGSNEIDTLYNVPLDNGSSRNEIAATEEMTVIGVVPLLSYMLPPMQRFEPYLAIGVGFYYAHYQEIGRTDPGWSFFREGIGLPAASESRAVRADIRGGVGIGIRLNKEVSLDIGYIFKYWSPGSCAFQHDLPLHGVTYRETFRSHQASIGVAWGGRE